MKTFYTSTWWLLVQLLVSNIRHLQAIGTSVPEFSSENAKDASNLKGISFRSRVMLPYGPDESKGETVEDLPWSGYAYGMAAADEVVYDSKNQYFYALSGRSFLTVTDFSDPVKAAVTDLALAINEYGGHSDMDVCPQQNLLLIAVVSEEGQPKVLVFDAVDRENPKKPTLLYEIPVVAEPGLLRVRDDCSVLAIAHSNAGDGIELGSITLVKGLENIRKPSGKEQVKIENIPLDEVEGWDDQYILEKGLNMPLTLKALEYWDDHSHLADELDFSEARANYRPSIFMSPESLAWAGPEQKELLVNLQPNNGVLRLDVVHNRILDIAGYGLKNHEQVPIDINSHDKACKLETYDHLFAMRGPDAIATVRYNGKIYLFTSNEGELTAYKNWKEELFAKDIFNGTNFELKNMQVPQSIFDPSNPSMGSSALFNSKCEGPGCVGDAVIGIGSNAIDYESDSFNPIFHRMVLHGGRGWSIYEVPEDPSDLLKLVYDSADTVERGGCEKFPWAHNALHDYDSAPINLPNNTLYLSLEEGEDDRELIEKMNDPMRDGCEDQGDGRPGACPLSKWIDQQSANFGSSVESVGVGVACGRLLTAVVTEKSSLALLYDITEINRPSIVDIFHLSPISETKSPGLSYNEGTIGDVVTRSITFVDASDSSSGKAAVIFAGQESGTVSYYEIQCAEDSSSGDGLDEPSSSSASGGHASFLLVGLVTLLVLTVDYLNQ